MVEINRQAIIAGGIALVAGFFLFRSDGQEQPMNQQDTGMMDTPSILPSIVRPMPGQGETAMSGGGDSGGMGGNIFSSTASGITDTFSGIQSTTETVTDSIGSASDNVSSEITNVGSDIVDEVSNNPVDAAAGVSDTVAVGAGAANAAGDLLDTDSDSGGGGINTSGPTDNGVSDSTQQSVNDAFSDFTDTDTSGGGTSSNDVSQSTQESVNDAFSEFV